MTEAPHSRGSLLGAVVVIAALHGLLPSPAQADGATAVAAPGAVSYAIPESPAFTFLGASPTEVTQPGNVRDLAAELIHGIDENGKLQQGFAVTLRPGYTMESVNLERYRKRGLGWMLYNSEVSLGTARTSGDDGATDLAIGLRMTLYDEGDPMAHESYARLLAGTINGCKPDGPSPSDDVARAAAHKGQLECMAAASRPYREEWLDRHWNATRLSLGFATGWTAPESTLADLGYKGWSLWLAGGHGFGKWDQVVGQLKYTAGSAGMPGDELSYGARAFLGTGRMHGYLELVGKKLYDLPDDTTDDATGEWSGGIELRVFEGTWVTTGIGSNFATAGDDKLGVRLGLKWGISDDSRIRPAATD